MYSPGVPTLINTDITAHAVTASGFKSRGMSMLGRKDEILNYLVASLKYALLSCSSHGTTPPHLIRSRAFGVEMIQAQALTD